MTTAPRIPVAWGEVIDKITILEIKLANIRDSDARANVSRELAFLLAEADALRASVPGLVVLERELRAVNEALWKVEDDIRAKDRADCFDAGFVELARSVYRLNDHRAAIKRQINVLVKSEIVEEKFYRDLE